ncbi:hypothetical protein BDW02DRAFT_625671, partial [Decorospora gaudefroyi]
MSNTARVAHETGPNIASQCAMVVSTDEAQSPQYTIQLVILHAELAALPLTDRYWATDEPVSQPTFHTIDYRSNNTLSNHSNDSVDSSPQSTYNGYHPSELGRPSSPASKRWLCPRPLHHPFKYDILRLASISEEDQYLQDEFDLAAYGAYIRTLAKASKKKRGKKAKAPKKKLVIKPPVAAYRPAAAPRCRYGTRRLLNRPGDDHLNQVCRFHKSGKGQGKKGHACE